MRLAAGTVALVAIAALAGVAPQAAAQPRLRGYTCAYATVQNWLDNHPEGPGVLTGGPFLTTDEAVSAVRVRCEMKTPWALVYAADQTVPGRAGAAAGPIVTSFHHAQFELCTRVWLVYADREELGYTSDPCPVYSWDRSEHPPPYVES